MEKTSSAEEMISLRKGALRIALALTLVLGLAFAGFGLSSCGTRSSNNDTNTQPLSSDLARQIDSTIEAAMSENKVPGAIVGVWWEGQGQYVKAYGEADISSGSTMTTSDLFKAASVTKTITGSLVLELIDQGKLNLDDMLSQYDFAAGIPGADKITIRMLLNQTSGLPDPSNWSPQMIAVEESDPYHQFTPDEIKAFAIAIGPVGAPGEKYSYSNWNYYLLGLLVERATGTSLADAMQTMFFDKLGMENTRLDPNAEFLMSREHSLGYSWNPANEGDARYVDMTGASTSAGWAAGSAVTDINDFKRWIEGVADGTLLTPEMRQTRLADGADIGGGSQYLLGVVKTGDVLWHNGAVAGYSSWAGSNPDKGLTVCLFMNLMPGPEVPGQPGANVLVATTTASKILGLFK